MIKAKWTGTAGLEISYGERKLLIDPYYSRVKKFDILFKKISPAGQILKDTAKDLNKVSAIIASHTHFDHVFDIPVLHSILQCRVLGSESLNTLFQKYKKPGIVEVCKGYEEIIIDETAKVTMLPSLHGNIFMGKPLFDGEIDKNITLPMKASQYKTGQVFAPLIRIGEKSILHLGSAGFIEDALKDAKCDILFLCVPGWDKTKGYPLSVIEMVKPETIALIHYDDFSKLLGRKMKTIRFQKMDKLVKVIRSAFPSIDLKIPKPFEDIFI